MESTKSSNRKLLSGMTGFSLIAVGQAISLIGSGMTNFAIVIWAWEMTGQATTLALAGFFGFAPVVIMSPFAGALVDRWNRKLVMALSDLAAGLATIILFTLYLTDNLQIWHLYVLGAFVGVFQAFQWPAFSAAISVMIPKEQYARAAGVLQLAQSLSGVLAPGLAGALIGLVGIAWVFTIDIITFVVAISVLLLVHIPQPETSEEGRQSKGSIWKEAAFGFKYIWARPSLFWLQMVFFTINLTATFGFTVVNPMILARTGNDAAMLGVVQSFAAAGGIGGGLLLSVWGGPKRRIHGVLMGMILAAVMQQTLMGVGKQASIWAFAGFCGALILPVLNGSNQAIWQAKVEPDLQGRVFSVRRLIAQITAPVAMLMAGPLADNIFEPAMSTDSMMSSIFGWLVGTGPGAGMAVMLIIAGTLGVMVGIGGYMFPIIRNVETILPDHDQKSVPAITPQKRQRLQELLDTRQALLSQAPTTDRDRALKAVSQQLRTLGQSS
jgi:MFS family permease